MPAIQKLSVRILENGGEIQPRGRKRDADWPKNSAINALSTSFQPFLMSAPNFPADGAYITSLGDGFDAIAWPDTS